MVFPVGVHLGVDIDRAGLDGQYDPEMARREPQAAPQ